MTLAVPTRQDRYVPPLWTHTSRPSRTFLGACVDELLEQREHPWDPARLHREWVEQKLNAIQQELADMRARSKTPTKPRSLGPKVRMLVDTLVDLFPHTRGDPGYSLSEVAVEDMIIARLKVTHPGFTFKRTSLRTALKYVRRR